MVSMFMIMFFILIITPFLYLLYRIRYFSLKYKIIFSITFSLAFLIMLTKIILKIDDNFFFIATYISQFYIILLIIMAICFLLFQAINRFTQSSHQKYIYIGMIVFSFLITGFGFYSHESKTIKSYNIVIHKETTLDKLNIGMVSDIHLGTGTYLSHIETLVQQVNEKNFDLFFLCGDIFDESTPKTMIAPALQLLSKIQTTYGIYAVSGNHEYYANFLDATPYLENNITYLSDSYVSIDGLFNIVGREDKTLNNGQSMDAICTDMNTSIPTFLLDHNPQRYKESISYSDLQLSGHTHNGQFFPGSLITNSMYDNAYGLLEKNDYSLIVSSGYGSWGFPFRLLTNCELVEVSVTFSKK